MAAPVRKRRKVATDLDHTLELFKQSSKATADIHNLSTPTEKLTTDIGLGCYIDFIPQAINPQNFPACSHQELFTALKNNLNWEQRSIKIFGKQVLQPRLTYYVGDYDYTYSGHTLLATKWEKHPLILQLKQLVERITNETFNSALLNYYRNGNDYISYHSDNERLYGDTPTIVTVSLGESARTFSLEAIEKRGDLTQREEILLPPGSVLVMRGLTQKYFKHSVLKSKGEEGGRISVTFRKVLSPESLKRKKKAVC